MNIRPVQVKTIKYLTLGNPTQALINSVHVDDPGVKIIFYQSDKFCGILSIISFQAFDQ